LQEPKQLLTQPNFQVSFDQDPTPNSVLPEHVMSLSIGKEDDFWMDEQWIDIQKYLDELENNGVRTSDPQNHPIQQIEGLL
jgi:glutaredoxin 2